MAKDIKIDEIDKQIIRYLQENARTANSEIARRLGMAPSGILERIRKLEKKGVIKGYYTTVDEKVLGYEILAYIFVKLNARHWRNTTSEAIAKIENVLEIHEIVGQHSYLVKVICKNTDELSKVLKEKLGDVETIQYTETTIVLSTYKNNPKLPI